MTISVTHAFTSPVADEGNPNEVGPNEWNAAHNLTQSGERILGKLDSGDGATAENTAAQVRLFLNVADGATAVVVSDAAYDATSWNGNTDAPTKNAIRDKLETMGGGSPWEVISDTTISSPVSEVDHTIDFSLYAKTVTRFIDVVNDTSGGAVSMGYQILDNSNNVLLDNSFYWEVDPAGAARTHIGLLDLVVRPAVGGIAIHFYSAKASGGGQTDFGGVNPPVYAINTDDYPAAAKLRFLFDDGSVDITGGRIVTYGLLLP